MAHQPFKLPDIGEGTAEAELVTWYVAVGDRVEEDQPLCDVMTDKATVEVTSPFTGLVVERRGEVGQSLAVGSVILVFDSAAEPGDAQPPSSAPVEKTPPIPADLAFRRPLAAPALRKRAAALGIDLVQVKGSGPGGRVRQLDLDAYRAYHAPELAPEPLLAALPPKTALRPEPDADEIDEMPIIGLRRRIAERLQDTKRRIPHFSYIEEVDVTALEALRTSLNLSRGQLPKLTFLPFLVRALVRTLPKFPNLNALYDDANEIVRRYRPVHAGIATQTPAGLVVTVLKHSERHDLWTTAAEIARLADSARSGRAAAADLTGSTITITSLGALGGVATTPVINSPEVCIIGVNKMIERPVVRHGRIEVAMMMNLSASFDHRVVDGWIAATFVQQIKALLETPALLFV